MQSVALVTAQRALALDEDMPWLQRALAARGVQVAVACWDDLTVDWSPFDAALLRSTWDYSSRLDEFLDWAAQCAAQTRLLNPLELVRWNLDKHYLRDLAGAGVPVMPTRFVETGEVAGEALGRFLEGGPESVSVGRPSGFDELVIKPVIGSGSRDAARYPRHATAGAVAHLERLLQAGRAVLLQPYLESVETVGETALMFFGGRYSHAIRKGALLKPGGVLTTGLFAPERIEARTPTTQELAVAAAACRAIPGGDPLYARIDLIRDASGTPAVLELELAEPSLFFAFAPGSAEALADELLRRLRPAS